MTTRKSWQVLWRRIRLREASLCEREERVGGAIDQSHVRGIAFVQRLARRGAAGFASSLSSQFFYPSQEGHPDSSTQHAESRNESLGYCHFSEAYGSRLELRRCRDLDVVLFVSPGLRRDFP